VRLSAVVFGLLLILQLLGFHSFTKVLHSKTVFIKKYLENIP